MILSEELQAAMAQANPLTCTDVIAEWRRSTSEARAEIARLRAKAAELETNVVVPDLTAHRSAAVVRKQAGIDELIESVKAWASSDDATRYQLRALATYQDSRTMHNLSELLGADAGAASIAFQLVGLLSPNWRHLAPEKPSCWPLAALLRIAKELSVGAKAVEQIRQAHQELGEIDTFLTVHGKGVV